MTVIARRGIVSCFAAFAFTASLFGARFLRAAVSFPDPQPLAPLEAQMLVDAADGKLGRFSLIDAALVASGANRETLDLYRQKYAGLSAAAQHLAERQTTPLARARALFEFLHREILTGGYDAQSTELICPLTDGRFNCASATVLFTALAGDCGLTVHPIERPRHAMCSLAIGGEQFDIETTCPNWFELTPAMREQAERAALARDAAADRQTARREIGPAALVAVIYYNRGVDLLNEKRFAEAVSVDVRALRLDPDNETAAGNLLASINNWALALGADGRFQEAISLLNRGLAEAPDHEPFHTNLRHIYRTWIQSLAAAGRQSEALAVLADARAADPGSPIWNLWAVRLTRQISAVGE
ncbi:MAG TPA: tetratricopeptide repeat protein [Pirellulales bacterium]|nr:tetratricopeptide repeat protein [Pirellulales bacterium]